MKRKANDPIFGSLAADDSALEYIEEWESRGNWQLVATRPTDDMSALTFHKGLEQKYGEVIHYMHNAWRGNAVVGINLYFVKVEALQRKPA